jgi:ketosteroid isomerase-like protein
MRKNPAYFCVIVLFVVALVSAETPFASEDNRKGVNEAVKQFYAALNAMFTGDMDPMQRIWSHANDVTYMGPAGGYRTGWDQVIADWEAQAAMKLGGRVTPKNMRIILGRDLAVVSNYEIGENSGPDGKPQEVRIRVTNLFRKEDGKWKMIGHHTDLLPFLEK